MAIKFLSGLNLSNVTAGSILKLDSNGNIVAAVDGTDYNTAAGAWSDVSSNIYRNSDVRIGTYQSGVAPAARLHVFDYQTTDPKLLIEDGNTGDASMEFKISTQSYTMGIDNSDSDKFVIAASTALGTTNVLEISTAGAAAFQAGLLVDGGSAMFDTDGGNNPLYIARNSSTSESLKIYVNDTEAFFESIQDETGGDHGRFAFKMDGDSPSAYTRWLHGNTERMRLTAGGNLGIGITDPDVALEVGGTIKASTNGDGFVIGSPTTVKFKLGVYGGNDLLFKDPNNNVLMTLTSAGNVGFAGSVSIQSDNEERFLIRSNDYTISRIISRGNSGDDLDKGLFSLMSSDGTNNNVEVVRLDSASNSWLNGGNVGIGTSSPSYGLDVNHNAARIGSSSQTTTSLYLTATNTDGAPAIATQIIMQGYEGRAKGTFYTDSGADGEWFDGVPYNGNHNYWQVGFDETGGQAEYSANAILRVRDNGNVGIGVANPQQKLDVAGVIKGESSIRVDSSATGSPYFGLYQNGAEKAFLQYADTGDSLVLQSDGEVVIRGDVQHGQGDADAVISFKQSTNELGKFDQDGYLYATGFKTSGTTGFLKSDGTVDTTTLGTMAAAATSDYKTSDQTETYVATELGSYTATTSFGTNAFTSFSDHSTQGYLTALPSHNHDDRYYTETELNGFFKSVTHQGNYISTANWSNDGSGSVNQGWGAEGYPFSPTGDFNQNGETAENIRTVAELPNGAYGVVWRTPSNDASSSSDGGWDMDIQNVQHAKAYRSVVYFQKTDDSTSGTFYHGCHGSHTLQMNGNPDTNPYFQTIAFSNLVENRWYVSVGYIQPYQYPTATNSTRSGIYDCYTGKKISNGTDYMMKSGSTTQRHRTYQYYSTDTSSSINWWSPRFEEINGNEPSLAELIQRVGVDGELGLNFHSKFPAGALDSLSETTDATNDKILLWDESADVWKQMTLEDLQDSIDTDTTNFATAAQGTTADAALPKAGGTMTGDLTLDDGSGASPSLYLKNGDDNYWRIFNSSTLDLTFKVGTTTKFNIDSSGNATFGGLVSSVGISSTIASATSGYFATNTAIPANQIVHIRDNVATTEVSSAGGIKISSSPGNDVFLLKRWDHSGSASYFSLRNNSNAEHLAINMANGNANFAGDITVNRSIDTSTPLITVSNDDSKHMKMGVVRSAAGTAPNTSFIAYDGDFRLIPGSSSATAKFTLNSSGNATFAGSVTVEGNLIVNGTTTTLNTTTVEVEDNILQLNTTQGTPDTATAATSGISVYRGDGVTQASFIFDDADDTWDLTNDLAVAGSTTFNGGVVKKGSGGYYLQTASAGFRAAFWDNGTETRIFADGNGSTAALVINDNNTTFAGSISTPGITSTLTNSILIDYTGSDANGNDAGLKIINDASDWGIYIRKDQAAEYGLRIDGGGTNAIWVSNAVGGAATFKLNDDGDIITAGNITSTGEVNGKNTYTKSFGSLDTTGEDVAGLASGSNGNSASFTFTCHGHTGGYQKIVYSCYNTSGTTWNVKKVIDEGTNDFDVTVSASGATRIFTFVSRSGTKSYSPMVHVEHVGHGFDSTHR
jgi:hypothetical protein